jgi:hypothetical protein
MAPWGTSTPGGDTTASWIWNTSGADVSATYGPWVHFFKNFVSSSTFTGTLYIICDNHGFVYLNGKPISSTNVGGGWGGGNGNAVSINITQGNNLIEIIGYNVGGPAGLIASLYNGGSLVLNTDSSWTCYQSSLTNNIVGLYSCKKVNHFYSGPIFNIRRSSDNATSDFYSDSIQSYVTTGASNTGTTLSSWLGGSTGYVVVWHDQSGNGYHATNYSNNTTQPNLSIQNGKYVIQFQNANGTVLNIPSLRSNTVFCHFYNTNSTYASILSTAYDYQLRFGGGSGTNIYGDYNDGDWYYRGYYNGGTSLSYNNGVSTTTLNINDWNYLCLSVTNPVWNTSQTYYQESYFTRIGSDGYSPTRSINGYMAEMILHNTPLIERDILYFYNNRIFS